MGMDFSALLHYDGATDDVLAAISQLESKPSNSSTDAVVELGRQEDFAFARDTVAGADWRAFSDWETPLQARPALPSTQQYLQLPSDFHLTFGHDAVWIYHTLRWLFFTIERKWQAVMLNAICHFVDIFLARDCIVTSDFNPAILEFQNGASFSAAIAVAESKGEGHVQTLDDLHIDKGVADDLVFVDTDGGQSAIPIWNSHGYWRLECNAPQSSDINAVNGSRR